MKPALSDFVRALCCHAHCCCVTENMSQPMRLTHDFGAHISSTAHSGFHQDNRSVQAKKYRRILHAL
jgi:hypothetical protein